MRDHTKLHDVFPAGLPGPYDRKLVHEIENHRSSLGGTLFVDRVMRALGLSMSKVYPPKSDNALRQLHRMICEAGMPTHHKQSLFYYMLLDFDAAGTRQSVSQGFASDSGMPDNYQVFVKGLWHMDRREFRNALEYVAHPSLSPDFADDIIMTLVRHAPDGCCLALSYFDTVQPVLKSSLALELLFDAMARTNIAEALVFSRTHPQHTREQLFRQWIRTILSSERGQESCSHMSELAFMPFDSAEEEWFEEYLTTGEGRSLSKANDTLLIRKIACDRFSEVGKQRVGGQWAAVLEGIKNGIDGRGG